MDTVNSHGAQMPALGFGTFRMSEAEVAAILPLALKVGFRHVDTAQAYRNEAAVGAAIEESGIARDEIFLTTKVSPDNLTEDRFIASVEESLRKLKTDRVDLLLLHWPKFDMPIEAQIAALNRLVADGKVRHVGVSNYTTALMARAVELSRAPIVTNQIEYHPYLNQHTVLEAARSYGMGITAYYVMAKGKVPNEPLLQDIGARYGKTAAQVGLRWAIQQIGVAALTKTATESRLAENFAVTDFILTGEEMQAISALARPDGRLVSPAHLAPQWD